MRVYPFSAIPVNPADVPPLVPKSLDDEFNGDFIDTTNKWAWFNQSTATAHLANSRLAMTIPSGVSDASRGITQAVPGSTPWVVAAKLEVPPSYTGLDFNNFGLVLRESGTAKAVSFGFDHNTSWTLIVFPWTSNTATGAIIYQSVGFTEGGTYYLQIRNDGTKYYYSFSLSGIGLGQDRLQTNDTSFFVAANQTIGTNFTTGADTIGFWGDTANASGAMSFFVDWFRQVV